MSLISPASNSSASVALRLLTDAAARQSGPMPGTQLKGLTGTLNSASLKTAIPSNDTKIILSLAAAEQAYGSDSFLMQTARGRADEVQITTSTTPSDKASYKLKILQQLEKDMVGDPGFMAALKAGKVKVLTADEVPELNFQPMVSFTMFKNGSTVGSGGFTPSGFNHEQLNKWESTRGQVVLGDAYAYYDKSV